MNKYLIVTFALLSCFGLNANNIEINNSLQRILISENIFYLEDATNQMSLEEIVFSEGFKEVESKVPNFGLSNSSFWFKLEITDNTEDDLLLELAQPILDEIEFYDTTKNGYKPTLSGEQIPHSERLYEITHFVFPLNLKKGETKTYFIKVKNSTQVQVPIYISNIENIVITDHFTTLFASIFFGIMLAMIIYNSFIYFFVRDSSYLFYIVYIIILTVTQLTPKGYTYQYFWPNSPEMAKFSMFLMPILTGVTAILFFNQFLKTKTYIPIIRKILRVFLLTYFVAFVLLLFESYYLSYTLIDFCAMTVSIIMLVGAIVVLRKGYRSALYYLIGWSIFLVGVVLFVLKDIGVLPHNNFTNYTMMIGAAIETLLLSIGLADRINTYKRERAEARENELKLLRENELIVKESNIQLEKKVKKRTLELEQVNDELNQTILNLKNAQQKLIESEKMASLGHLTAGVAHEINNPINFVFSNITPLKRDVEDLKDLINLYDSLDVTNFNERIGEIKKFKKELDYDYLMQELDDLIMGIEEGAKRTGEIVKGLRNFSRIDDENMVTCDLNEGMKSTLMLLNNKLDNLELITDFKDVPQILCYPGKLNQTFMNFITNAIDSVQDKFQGKSGGWIRVSTHYNSSLNEAVVEIEDNGKGIPDELKNKIYDPFFTTKTVGKGTGLGLSISYKIIESHEGSIDLFSKINEGAKFVIHLPVG